MKLTPEQRQVRVELADRSGGHCEARFRSCCTRKAEHPHHRKLKGQGGQDTLENFLHVCAACHRYIHGHVKWSLNRGYLVHSWDDPAKIALPNHVKSLPCDSE